MRQGWSINEAKEQPKAEPVGAKEIKVDGIYYNIQQVDDTAGKDDAVLGKRANARQCTRFLSFGNCRMGQKCSFVHIRAEFNKAPRDQVDRATREQKAYDSRHGTNIGFLDRNTGVERGKEPRSHPVNPGGAADSAKDARGRGRSRSGSRRRRRSRSGSRSRERRRDDGRQRRRERSGSLGQWRREAPSAGGSTGGARTAAASGGGAGGGKGSHPPLPSQVYELSPQVQKMLQVLYARGILSATYHIQRDTTDFLLSLPEDTAVLVMQRACEYTTGQIRQLCPFLMNIYRFREEKKNEEDQKREDEEARAARTRAAMARSKPAAPDGDDPFLSAAANVAASTAPPPASTVSFKVSKVFLSASDTVPDPPCEPAIGDEVIAQGLVGAKQYNGFRGKVMGIDAADGRRIVVFGNAPRDFDTGPVQLALKCANLKRVPARVD